MKIRTRRLATTSPQRSQSTRSRLSPWLRLTLCSLCALWLCGVVSVRGAQAQDVAVADMPLVEKVDVQGSQFLQKETLLFYVSMKPGERYDERRLKDDFRRLWDTGFLDDMRVDVMDGEAGKVIVFTVKERKRIQIVDYRGSKALTTSAIEDKLKEKEAALRLDSFYDPSKARRVEAIIKEMLAEKGRPFATVKHDAKAVGGAGQQVSFIIEDGPKAKIKHIEFTGNEKFSDGKLRGTMKTLKPAGFWNLSWLGGKSTYTEDKWVEPDKGARARLQEFYLNRGFVTATIGEPQITYADKPGGSKKKPIKWATLTIPVTEGDQYRVGELKFEGMTIVKEEYARSLFKMEPGDVYEEKQFKKAYDKLRDAYGSLGYFQWTVLTDRKPDPEKKTVDVTVRMDEDKQYFVSRIRFTGNDTTRDKVIRREVYMNEGDVFNTEALKLSIRRINQLGYFKPMEQPPHIAPSAAGDNKLDVTFKVEEQNRNQFTFGGGVSGLEGTFINASFSTANFLGAGETFQISAQTGRRTKNYQIAITEPYLFDRPITAGFDLFDRSITYETIDNVVGYKQASRGGSLVAGIPLGRFTRLFTNYSYEIIDISGLEEFLGIDPDPDDPENDDPVFDPFIFGEEGRRRESRITPSVVHNTVDNPWTPRSGIKLSSTFQVAGGILGGTVNFFRPELEAVVYIPHLKRTALGMRGQVAYIRPFGDTRLLPYYQRFFLGGETQIRGFNIRSVGPLGPENRALGGNKYALFNAEYYIDIGGPLRFLFFFDAGQAFLEGDPLSVKDFLTSTGAELRFIMPVLNVPFRLIYAYNPTREFFHDKSTFKFAVGTTF
jgi:outer membrane protein insertion porin family